METGMVLRPGLTTTDPQFQEGTTMTPQIMKGDALWPLVQLGLCVSVSCRYERYPARQSSHYSSTRRSRSPVLPTRRDYWGYHPLQPRLVSPTFCKLGFQDFRIQNFKKSKLSNYVTGVTRIWKEDRIQKTYKSCPFKRSLRNQDVDRMHRKMDETVANSWSTSAYVHIYICQTVKAKEDLYHPWNMGTWSFV